MTRRRTFRRSGDILFDVYGESGAGGNVSFQAPVAALEHLRWVESAPVAPASLDLQMLTRRRALIRERLQHAPISELTNADLIEGRTLADPNTATALEARFQEMVEAWREHDVTTLACAAGVILSMNPTHEPAASELTAMLFSDTISQFGRTMAAGHLSDAFQPDVESEAMLQLRDALLRMILARDVLVWGPFAYSCTGHLVRLVRRETLSKCGDEFRQRDEHDRLTLIAVLAEIPGADVLSLLLRHSMAEESERLQVRLLNVLGDFIPERRRSEILESALQNESPSLRWFAIKSLRRLRPKKARDLAKASLPDEPDHLLRNLLEEAIDSMTVNPREKRRPAERNQDPRR